MKRITLFLFALAIGGLTAGAASAHDTSGIDRREAFQRERIREGVRCRDLTRNETRRLVRGQMHVRQTERRFGRDGRLGPRERMIVQRMQNRQSRAIHRMRHNGRDRQNDGRWNDGGRDDHSNDRGGRPNDRDDRWNDDGADGTS